MPWEAAVSKARELGVVVRQGKAPGSEAGALQVKAGAWGARKAWAAFHLKTAKGLNRFPKVPNKKPRLDSRNPKIFVFESGRTANPAIGFDKEKPRHGRGAGASGI